MSGVLVAPDAFKGTHTARAVADAVGAGLAEEGLVADACPVADGGEGTAEALLSAAGGRWAHADVTGPLGAPVRARYGLLADGIADATRRGRDASPGGATHAAEDDGATAVLDVAEASGLDLVPEDARDPVAADTRGTGELILAAARAGATTIMVGSGGSATVDGGRGATCVLRAAGRGGRVPVPRLVVLCDVRTPWERAAAVFGPQKGASADDVALLTGRLDAYAATLPRDPRGVPMTGGAGGLAGGLWAAFGAELRPGAAAVLDAVGFDARAARSRAVVVGEGRLDATTAEGKVLAEAAARAGRLGVPCHAIVGSTTLDPASRRALGLADVVVASTAAELRAAGAALARRLIAAGG